MKNLSFLAFVLFLLFGASNMYAQTSESDPKHENHYKPISPIETDDYRLEFITPHTQQEFVYVKLKLSNKTKDQIILDLNKIKLQFPDNVFSPKQAKLVVEPMGTKSKVVKISGGYNFHVKNFSIEINGFTKLPLNGKVVKGEQFQLPPSKNDIQIGDFHCNLTAHDQSTKETSVSFNCVYKGTEVGLLDRSKISITSDAGVYATTIKKSKLQILNSGDEKKVVAKFRIPGKVLDMQFATMQLTWNNTFSVSNYIVLKDKYIVNLEFDPGLTYGNNK